MTRMREFDSSQSESETIMYESDDENETKGMWDRGKYFVRLELFITPF